MKRPNTTLPHAPSTVITGTGFSNAAEKAWVEGLCQQLGAKYDGNLSAHSTKWLVCRSILMASNSDKFRAALNFNIQVVSWKWLVDSAAAGKPLPAAPYKTDPPLPFPVASIPTTSAHPRVQPKLKAAVQSTQRAAPTAPAPACVSQPQHHQTQPPAAQPAAARAAVSQDFCFPSLTPSKLSKVTYPGPLTMQAQAGSSSPPKPQRPSLSAALKPQSHQQQTHSTQPVVHPPAQAQATQPPAAAKPPPPCTMLISSDDEDDAYVIPGTQMPDEDDEDDEELNTAECLMSYLAARQAASISSSVSTRTPATAATSQQPSSTGSAATTKHMPQQGPPHGTGSGACAMAVSPPPPAPSARKHVSAAAAVSRPVVQPGMRVVEGAGGMSGGPGRAGTPEVAARDQLPDQLARQLGIQGLSPVYAQEQHPTAPNDMLISPAPAQRPGLDPVQQQSDVPVIKLEEVEEGVYDEPGVVRGVTSWSGSSGSHTTSIQQPPGGALYDTRSLGSTSISGTSTGMPASDSRVTKRRPRVCVSTGFTPCSGELQPGQQGPDTVLEVDQGGQREVYGSVSVSSTGAASSGPSQHFVARGGVPLVSSHVSGVRVHNLVPEFHVIKLEPGIAAQQGVPGIAAQQGVPGIAAQQGVPGIAAQQGAHGPDVGVTDPAGRARTAM